MLNDQCLLGIYLLLFLLLSVDRESCFSSALLSELLAGACACAHDLITNEDSEGKLFLVVWPDLFDHAVLRLHPIDTLRDFLQVTLRIAPATGREDTRQLTEDRFVDKFISCFVAFLEVDSTDQRLKRCLLYTSRCV